MAGGNDRGVLNNLLSQHNKYRASQGVRRALVRSSKLESFAYGGLGMIKDMGSRSSRVYNDGRTCNQGGGKHTRRWSNKGFCYYADRAPGGIFIQAENLGYNYSTSDRVTAKWISSPDHRDNILNGNFRSVGFAYYNSPRDGRYWIALFSPDKIS